MEYKKEVNKFFQDNDLRFDAVSFYSRQLEDSEEPEEMIDTEFGQCDITEEWGALTWCVTLDKNGDTVNFQALDTLVGGYLGKKAGAF